MDETAKNSLQLPKPTADTRKIQDKLTTVGSGKKNLQIKTTVSYLSQSKSESCNIGTFYLFLAYLKLSSNLTLR